MARTAAIAAVGQEEGGTGPAHDLENAGRLLNEDAHPGHAQHNQHEVGEGAHGNNQQNMRALDALAEHEGVLRADGDDKGQPAGQARKRERGSRVPR